MTTTPKTNEVSHTPTPWIVSKSGKWIGGNNDQAAFDAGFLQEIAVMHDHHKRGKANAAFIVLAVNCHEELLSAAKEAFKFIEARSSVASDDWIDVWKLVNDAIAKAEGK